MIPHEVEISRYSGTHKEIGLQLGQKARARFGGDYTDKSLADASGTFLYQALGMQFELTPGFIRRVVPVVEATLSKVHPALLDEIAGFAKGLGDSYERVLTATSNFSPAGCSQFFLNGMHARNYDDEMKVMQGKVVSPVENEFLLVSPAGSFTSFGSGAGYLQRLDGINEQGLAVSLTFGAGRRPIVYGIGSAMFSRIVLDKASNVSEALEIFDETPYVTPNNVLISDANGNSAIIEQSAGKHRIRRGDSGTMLYCANSYLAPDMRTQQRFRNPTTKWREQKMQDKANILSSVEEVMDFLTADYPEGVFEPYYSDGLGTLWSAIYQPTTGQIHIAIGEGKNRHAASFNLSDPSSFDKLPMRLKTQVQDIALDDRLPLK